MQQVWWNNIAVFKPTELREMSGAKLRAHARSDITSASLLERGVSATPMDGDTIAPVPYGNILMGDTSFDIRFLSNMLTTTRLSGDILMTSCRASRRNKNLVASEVMFSKPCRKR